MLFHQLKQRIPEFIALSIVLYVFTSLHPRFESNDDVAMMNMVSGALVGKSIPTLIFINSLFGVFLQIFYTISTAINWYVLFVLIIPLFISTTLFCRLFFYTARKYQWLAFLLLGIFVFFFLKNFIFLQFTRSAYLLVLSGAFTLLLSFLEKEQPSSRTLYLTGFLIGYAFLVRPMAALSGLIILTPIFFYIRTVFSRESALKISCPLIVIFICGQLCNAITMSGPEWEDYHLHNKARSAVLDTPRQNLVGKKKYAKHVGLSPTTLQSISRWYFPDDKVFSTKLFSDISEKMPLNASPKKIKQTYHIIKKRHKKSGYQAYLYFWAFLFTLTMLFPLRLWPTSLFLLAASAGSLHIFYHTMKISPRVTEPLLLLSMFTVIAILLIAERKQALSPHKGGAALLIATLGLSYFGLPLQSSGIQLIQKADKRRIAADNLDRSIKKLRQFDPEGFFFPLSDNLRTKHQRIKLFYPNTTEYAQLKTISSGWTLHTPFYREHLKNNQLWPELPRKMLNPHRYYVSPGSVMRIIKRVYAESYGLKIKEKKIHTFIQPITKNKVGVYRISVPRKNRK